MLWLLNHSPSFDSGHVFPQAYILSTVEGGSAAASSKIDDLRKTAAVQTAMDMANSLTQGVANLPSKVPESLTESINRCVCVCVRACVRVCAVVQWRCV